MSTASLLTVALIEEADIIVARQRARQIAGLLGYESQDQTRIATAVSEIARNATSYGGGGRIEFMIEQNGEPSLIIYVRDRGPGITDLQAILDGRFKSEAGMGVGILGTRRLMDCFAIESSPDKGTEVLLGKRLPRNRSSVTSADLGDIGRALAATGAANPMTEARTQNQELMQSLADLSAKQEETERLYAELEEANRGVVALYAELDVRAAALSELNATLEMRVEAAVAESEQANETLRQSQKMEAVGQLTGGIAHDFNNLLQIVTGNLEMLLRQLPPDDARMRRAAENAMSGAQRAATLTQRLLAFSRRQPLAPKPLNANHMVDGMFDLMRRTLGEAISIETHLAGDLWAVEADGNQLENALLNLGVNARDAMASGGALTIATANGVITEADAEDDALPGEYVSVAVRDTGAGMSDETLSRVFEPFFTTKEIGKGTGLGLSMVYGFVKQSGGHLRIESSLGRGTTVTLYLPRYLGPVALETAAEREADPPLAHPGEAILLVEDDADVRAFTHEALGELGYIIHCASNGSEAIASLKSDTRIDLVFTDVVLTGPFNGRDVADQVLALRPGTPVLFTTGYAGDAISPAERVDADVVLLPKPFTLQALGNKISELLVRSRQRRRPRQLTPEKPG